MAQKRAGYIPVDDYSRQPDAVERIAAHFGVDVSELKRCGDEIRSRCFLLCGKKHATGDRALAIQATHDAKIWKCHEYGCGKQGNLVKLVDLLLPGGDPDAKVTGDRFRAVAQTMQQIFTVEENVARSDSAKRADVHVEEPASEVRDEQPKVNIPLEESDNERVRSIADLYRKLTLDLSQMPPHASRYVRERPFLTPEVAADRQLGYLPMDTGGDRTGGTMRGKFVAAIKNQAGKIVAYAGRDTDWERKHKAWIAGNREGKEPAKWVFPSTFHRGVELFNQDRVTPERVGIKLKEIGLPVVEGIHDVTNLDVTLNTPSVALLSNHATDAQIERIAHLAHQVAGGVVTLLYDCDEAGDAGMDRDTVKFAKLCRVQRAWARDMHDGRFAGMEPERLTVKMGKELRCFLATTQHVNIQ